MSTNHILETVVEKLTTELNNRCTEYGFEKRIKSKLPSLKLSVKTLIGNVFVAESKHSGKGYASIHLNRNWYNANHRYKTKHSYIYRKSFQKTPIRAPKPRAASLNSTETDYASYTTVPETGSVTPSSGDNSSKR